MNKLIDFQKTICFFFVISYVVGGSFLFELLLDENFHSTSELQNGTVGIACLIFSLFLYYLILKPPENDLRLYQKGSISVYIILSYLLPLMSILQILKFPVYVNLVDMGITFLLIFHSVVIGAIHIKLNPKQS